MSQNKSRYTKTASSAQWVYDQANDQFLWRTEIITYSFDKLLRDWIKTDTEVTNQTPEQLGYLKNVEFVIVFPDDSEPSKTFGKASKKQPKLLMQFGKVIVRPELKHVWLLKEEQRAIDQPSATSQKRVYVKMLDKNGLCYRFEYQTDDRVTCKITTEREIALSELKDLEVKGVYIAFHGKAMFNESEGFTYGSVALKTSVSAPN